MEQQEFQMLKTNILRTALFASASLLVACSSTHTIETSETTDTSDSAVKWMTTSKEYRLLTESAYMRAGYNLKQKTQDTPWVVMMDIDETILDNNGYQLWLNEQGKSFDPKTWADWVKKEQAPLVPGAKGFIGSVLISGGKLALITNRERQYDEYTWRNLQRLGLPITVENTCLIGRSDEDKQAVDHQTIINDKDLRRQQISRGNASCFNPDGKRHSDFPPLEIVMQVGDNIEDFAGVSQESADIDKLLSKHSVEYVLLPNPVYGSW